MVYTVYDLGVDDDQVRVTTTFTILSLVISATDSERRIGIQRNGSYTCFTISHLKSHQFAGLRMLKYIAPASESSWNRTPYYTRCPNPKHSHPSTELKSGRSSGIRRSLSWTGMWLMSAHLQRNIRAERGCCGLDTGGGIYLRDFGN